MLLICKCAENARVAVVMEPVVMAAEVVVTAAAGSAEASPSTQQIWQKFESFNNPNKLKCSISDCIINEMYADVALAN